MLGSGGTGHERLDNLSFLVSSFSGSQANGTRLPSIKSRVVTKTKELGANAAIILSRGGVYAGNNVAYINKATAHLDQPLDPDTTGAVRLLISVTVGAFTTEALRM